MTTTSEARSLLPLYERWMTRRRLSNRTIGDRIWLLRMADRQLPYGLDDVTEDEIFDWLKKYTGWTLATYDAHLRGFFAWAAQRGHLTCNPMIDLEAPEPGPRIPHPCEDDDLAHALTAAPEPWRRVAKIGAFAGLRCAEMCRAHTDHIVQGTRLKVYGKGGKWRTVPLHPVLQEEFANAAPGFLLVGKRGGPLLAKTLSSAQREVWRELGLPDSFTLHSLRHWCLTNVRRAGGDLLDATLIAGHSNPNTTVPYLATGDDRLLNVISRIQVPTAGVPQPDDGRLGRSHAA